MTAHAYRANTYSQGVEIEGKNVQDFAQRPDQIEAAIFKAVDFAIDNKLPFNETSIQSHAFVDLVRNNPKYKASTGELMPGINIGKRDFPKEFMQRVFLKKGKILYAQLTKKK